MQQQREDVLTLTVAWQQYFPSFAVPEEKWLRSWLYHNPLATVLGAFEFVAADRFYKTAEHLSKIITWTLKNVRYDK